MRLDGNVASTMQALDLLRRLDHPDMVHLGIDIDEPVAGEQLVETAAEAGGEVVSLRPDHQISHISLGKDVRRRSEEILVKIDLQVGEELRHRVTANIIDPGRIHGEVEIDGRYDER